MEEKVFRMEVPKKSPLAGKTLAETRMGTVLGMDVIAITRKIRASWRRDPEKCCTG
jgi:uncharacterized protein with PhoU and TrkA domain